MPRFSFVVPADSTHLRLDQCLARHIAPLSRRTAKIALDIGCVFVNKKRVKTASRQVHEGDSVVAHLEGAYERALSGVEESSPPLNILHEDRHLVVVHKSAGTLTAPTPESDRNNLLFSLDARAPKGPRHYVVHRLDLHTSGVLVFAKTRDANRALSEMFRKHDLVRQYDVFVHGQFDDALKRIDTPIEGKAAVTHFQVEKRYADYSWLTATLETGRTHQIRRHVTSVGHPVVLDPQYGKQRSTAPRMGLHAKRLSFVHPMTREQLNFRAPLPPDLQAWVTTLEATIVLA